MTAARSTVRLGYTPPFDAGALLGYLGARAVAGVEEAGGGVYRRTVRLGDLAGVMEWAPEPDAHAIRLTVAGDPTIFAWAQARMRHLADLDASPAQVADVLGADPDLAPLVAARPGLRVPGTTDGFELAVRAIVGQQVSVAGARTLLGRLAAALGTPLAAPEGGLARLFPTPAQIAVGNMDGLGLTGARIRSLRALAEAVMTGDLSLEPGAPADTTERLVSLPGIGPWTAAYIAMRALGDKDALPAADLGLRRALERRGLAGDAKSVAARAEAWRPYRAYATHHLWADPGPA